MKERMEGRWNRGGGEIEMWAEQPYRLASLEYSVKNSMYLSQCS